MGTFIIRPTSLASGGTPLYHVVGVNVPGFGWYAYYNGMAIGADSLVSFLQTIISPNPSDPIVKWLGVDVSTFTGMTSKNWDDTARFDFTGASIYLDGSLVPIAYASLPAGFTALTASLKINAVNQIIQPGAGTNAFRLQLDAGTESANDALFLDYDFGVFPQPTMIDIVNNGCGLRMLLNVTANFDDAFSQVFANLRIEGTYENQSFQYELETPTDPIAAADHVTVTSDPGPDALDFSQLLTATLGWTDSSGNPHSIDIPQALWITFTLHLWTFIVPTLTGDPPIVILSITSTQFSGSVELGRLVTIFFLNATGIYTLTAGKTNDTIYDNDNGGTVDVKIPNPFWKNGFIGG